MASRDQAALDQFEKLLKTLQRGRRVRIETGNYAIFLLQNADAAQLAEVLKMSFAVVRGVAAKVVIDHRFAARPA